MVVDYLRSCHASQWRFYANDPSKISSGRFYFAPKDAPPLPYFHAFYSATWTVGDEQSPTRLGPVQDAKRPWSPGKLTVGFPPPVPFGTAIDFERGLTFPGGVNTSILRDGVTEQCWINAGAPFLAFDTVGNISNCCLRAAYARIIDLQYRGEFDVITEFFTAWLGGGVTVTHFPDADLLPAMTIVHNAFYTIIISSGTANFQQLATQAWQSGLGPTNMGAWSTLPLWMDTSNVVADRLFAIGGNTTGPVLLVGHSYGAAVCCITAVRMREATPARELVVLTFGLPKPGDNRFADVLDEIVCVRVINNGDIVPHLPIDATQSLWYPLLIGVIVRQLWSEWIVPTGALMQAEDGTKVFEPMPSLTFDVLLPFVIAWATGQPMPQITAHRIETYIERTLMGCECPRWPLTEIAWAVLFPVPAQADLVFGGEVPAIGDLTFTLPVFKAIGELVIGAAAEPAIGDLVVAPAAEPAAGDLVLAPAAEPAAGELTITDPREAVAADTELVLGASAEPASVNGRLVFEWFHPGFSFVSVYPRYFWSGPDGLVGAYVEYDNGKFYLGLRDFNPGGLSDIEEIELQLDTIYTIQIVDDGVDLAASCEGGLVVLAGYGGTPSSGVGVHLGNLHLPAPVPVGVSFLRHTSDMSGILWEDSFVDFDGTELPPHVADVHPPFENYTAIPNFTTKIVNNEVVTNGDAPYVGQGEFWYDPLETSVTSPVHITLSFIIRSP